MTNRAGVLLILLSVMAAYFGRHYWLQRDDDRVLAGADRAATATNRSVGPALSPVMVETAHYTIASTAAPAQTALVAEAAESLHSAYTAFFRDSLAIDPAHAKLQLVLYKDQQEFKAHNQSSAWAEAFYLAPRCHAYYSADAANPYHWMVHEATHQLNNEVAHFKRATWIDEGLASYFGSSQMQDRELLPGTIDTNTYPIWWLSNLHLTGNLEDDIRSGRLIPLRRLLASGRGEIGRNVNLYYMEYWSLTHFLFHYEGGRYANRYKELIAKGGSLENFEKLLGPVDKLQVEWYDYLRQRIAEARDPADEAVLVLH